MNIGIDVRSLDTDSRTGVGEYTYCLLDELFGLDNENDYFLFLNSFQEAKKLSFEQENVKIIESGYPNKLFHLSQALIGYPRLDKFIEKRTNSELDVFFSPNLSFTSVSRDTKFILTVHDLTFEYFPEFLSKRGRLRHKIIRPKQQCSRADAILTPSENTKADLISEYRINSEKINVLYPGITSSFQQEATDTSLKSKYGITDDYILFLGTLEPRKNIISLIEAYQSTSYSIKDKYKLIIAGAQGWNNKNILQKIEQTNNVRYIGYIDSKDKPALFKQAELFVYPSLYEGFGFPVIESMSVNTPVVTSNRSSLSEIVKNSAYIVDPNDINSIKIGIESVLKDDKLRSSYQNKSKKILEEYNWKQTAQKFLNIIRSYE